MRSGRVVALLLTAVCACMPPLPAPPAPEPAAISAAETAAPREQQVRPRRIVFEDLFLHREDVPTDLRPRHSVGEWAPRNDTLFLCLGGPGGNESALATWADPDGREALWRLADLRWTFDDAAAAEAFRQKTIKHFEAKEFRLTPCSEPIGDVCTHLWASSERVDNEPHEIGLLFRIAEVMAVVEAGEGPRIQGARLEDDRVLPFARRAADRIRAALSAR